MAMFPSIFISARQPYTLTQQTLNSNIVKKKGAAAAKIIWALNSVLSEIQIVCVIDIANTLKAICSDSQIAKDFKLGCLKLMYIVNYGIAPHFKQLLDVKLKKAFLYTSYFDKSPNEISQESEMVRMVQYGDEEEN